MHARKQHLICGWCSEAWRVEIHLRYVNACTCTAVGKPEQSLPIVCLRSREEGPTICQKLGGDALVL